ncbi:pilus assembly protein [Maribius pontilimi]|uniref:Pilus assembly protein n=1 Tax=Palleronia pontilimi TaxID=1964209 RepID=A0A934IFH0_9RHOB|nr:pilus assembly protein [Palleronia pontilimi]MBJ3761816.1 pilus assembly protein [Palleronia pontilimi]
MIGFLKKFLRREDGYATAEVALLFPAVLWPFMLAMETGLIQIRQVMLERAMDVVVRDLRLGNPDLDTGEKLKAALCAEVLIMGDCERDIMLEMGPVQVADFEGPTTRQACADRQKEVNPVTNYTPGATNEMMLLRFCILHDPILPAVGLGKILPREAGGGFALTASTFFVNEPRD